MKLNVQCVYGTDRRKEKQRRKDGSTMYIFKNQTICNNTNDVTALKVINEDDPVVTEQNTEENDRDFFGGIPLMAKSISRDGSPPFDFGLTSLESCDINSFLKFIGEPLPSDDGNTLGSNISEDGYTQPRSSIVENPLEFMQRNRFIEAIFANDSHTLPGLQKNHILELSERHADLSSIDFDDNGKFLLSTVLCLGALTLRKWELLNSKSDQPKRSIIAEATAVAFNYYTIATDLIPSILAAPEIDGFCGLVLMANFMTIMIPLKGQLYLSKNALEVAVALNLHKRTSYDNTLVSDPNQLGIFLLFWNLWCSSCMLATLQGKQPFLSMDNISLPTPLEMIPILSVNSLSIHFMQLKVQLATLQAKIFKQLYVHSSINKLAFLELERELDLLSAQVKDMKSRPIYEEKLFYRSKVLMLELSCLKSQISFLLYRPELLRGESLRAVHAAKLIILELWSHYTKKFARNEKDLLDHLDWNFSYPLRTASLTLSISCMILQKYQQSLSFLSEDAIMEYTLAMEVLNDLVQVVPIEKTHVRLLTIPRSTTAHSAEQNQEDSLRFWTSVCLQ